MNTEELRTLKILETLENDENISQRRLASRLNLSLGLVNSFLKRLVNKGYCKISAVPKNRIKYYITPEGASEKTRLVYRYLQHSFQLYRDSYTKISSIICEFEKNAIQTIALWGFSEMAEIVFAITQGANIEIKYIVDDESEMDMYHGIPIVCADRLIKEPVEKVLITSFDSIDKITDQITCFGVQPAVIQVLH